MTHHAALPGVPDVPGVPGVPGVPAGGAGKVVHVMHRPPRRIRCTTLSGRCGTAAGARVARRTLP